MIQLNFGARVLAGGNMVTVHDRRVHGRRVPVARSVVLSRDIAVNEADPRRAGIVAGLPRLLRASPAAAADFGAGISIGCCDAGGACCAPTTAPIPRNERPDKRTISRLQGNFS